MPWAKWPRCPPLGHATQGHWGEEWLGSAHLLRGWGEESLHQMGLSLSPCSEMRCRDILGSGPDPLWEGVLLHTACINITRMLWPVPGPRLTSSTAYGFWTYRDQDREELAHVGLKWVGFGLDSNYPGPSAALESEFIFSVSSGPIALQKYLGYTQGVSELSLLFLWIFGSMFYWSFSLSPDSFKAFLLV